MKKQRRKSSVRRYRREVWSHRRERINGAAFLSALVPLETVRRVGP